MAKAGNRNFSDEDLMAFADGECGPELKREIEVAMKNDQLLFNRIEMFRGSAAVLRSAFPPVVNQPADDALVNLIRNSSRPMAEKSGASSNVVQFPVSKKPKPIFWQQAIAASVLLATGVAGGFLLGSPSPGQETGIASLKVTSEISKVLMSLSSGQSTKTSTGDLTVIASFKDAQGHFCREFENSSNEASKAVTVACRRNSNWQVVLQAALPAATDSFIPAGGAQALEAYLQSAGMNEPLSADEEKAFLQQ
jgi:hypothetical protein